MKLGRTIAKSLFLSGCAALGITGGVWTLDKVEEFFSKEKVREAEEVEAEEVKSETKEEF